MRSATGSRRQAGCAARATRIASATTASGAACARLATASERLGSSRVKAGPSCDSRPPTTWGSGSPGSRRASASADSKAASVPGALAPLV